MAKATRQTTQPAFVPVVLTLEDHLEVQAILDAIDAIRKLSKPERVAGPRDYAANRVESALRLCLGI